MRCDHCGGETILRRQTHHYKESGLDNVYLENVEVRYCEKCKTGAPRIPRIKELHLTIARAIALQDAPLSGPEMKFLRKHLGMKAKEWAEYLRIDASTLSRWESGDQQVGAQSDALIRLVYFRLLEERENKRVTEPVAGRIAALTSEPHRVPDVLVNMNSPGTYRYHAY
ncbi:MAG TPA: type II TA system antitoxin MqsA family protein [Blastocatellia bacterium]|nr:type II TA system antitoxin MqsA family protein [Blastocatellia bacterium]